MPAVYFIAWNELTKIGWSANVTRRLAQLQAVHAGAIVVHQIECPTASALEAALHHHFAPFRVEGEWFRLTPAMFDGLMRLDNLDDLALLPPPFDTDNRPPQVTVKLPPALHRKARVVASFYGKKLSDYLNEILTPLVNRAYEEVGRRILAEMAEEQHKEPVDSPPPPR